MAGPLAVIPAATIAVAGNMILRGGLTYATKKYGPAVIKQVQKSPQFKKMQKKFNDKVVKKFKKDKDKKPDEKYKMPDEEKALNKDSYRRSAESNKVKRRNEKLQEEADEIERILDLDNPPVDEVPLRFDMNRGGLLDDDRIMYKEGGPGIEALRKEAPEVVSRMGYQEGGSMDNQMEMAMEMSMESDDNMENNYTDFIMAEALSEEEEDMLMSKLEQDEQLQMLFDKVIDVAQEFAGSGPVDGPGSGVSDSIPARLSDGEFVFTAKATEEIGEDTLMSMMKEAESNADMRQPAQMGGVMDKNNPNPLGVQGSILDNREDDYTNPMEQPPIRGAGYGR